jgi:ABC-2 type transport system ATP-binding protein
VEEPIIELVDLTKQYGSFKAVDHLTLTIGKGEIFGLLGPNGAGKSTTILMMIGLTEPTSGSAKICGINSTSNPIEVKRKVGYLPEDVRFYDDRTGFENLIYTAQLNRIPNSLAKQKAEQLLIRVGLSDAINKKAGKYSRGMRQRLGLADVLIKNPEIIILDEPTLGIDPTGMREFLELISELRKEQGLTVLFSSHNLHQVQQVCDRVGIFVNGKLLAEGDVQSLAKKLFSENLFEIEVGIVPSESGVSVQSNGTYSTDWLKKVLQPIEGISSIARKNEIFQIKCSQDSTARIARVITESGAGLNYLNKKEYGLDDIYYRYFEGGINHE